MSGAPRTYPPKLSMDRPDNLCVFTRDAHPHPRVLPTMEINPYQDEVLDKGRTRRGVHGVQP